MSGLDDQFAASVCDEALEVAELRCDNHGMWSFCPEFPVDDWKYEVANGETRRGYWEWANAKLNEVAQEVVEHFAAKETKQ